MSDSRLTPPAHDEVEVSIFGPGKGESIAVHIGDGEWLIVDSCIDQRSKEIPVLRYLENIGVDVSAEVRLVVGTHAHDDHIAGLGRVFQACHNAQFVCSSASTKEEFLRHVEADGQIEAQYHLRQSIYNEYREIFAVLKSRPRGRRFKFAMAELPLLARPGSGQAPAVIVTALSPSSEAVERAMQSLADSVAVAADEKRTGTIDPNELAVAIYIVVGDTAVLLGADLLRGPDGCGWQAVLALEHFIADPLASVFKIPHHGSQNAHHDDVWTRLVSGEVISLVAPYRKGSKPLPSPEDVERLKGLSKAVYCSANPRPPTPNKAVRKTAASLSGFASSVRTVGYAGQVRARRKCGADEWAVTCFAPGLQL
ncbi:MBL fold metallo-hydrolase [Mycobacterium lentiflavum]|uniref:MBL fold metallo-hydrolase n=1 Tax=Mycobacterium lentiflavum TaxID=141349 RepID=UPI001111E5D0|nr:MBL fold metallo-hydrolase [Mycobacterium lentiflavum]